MIGELSRYDYLPLIDRPKIAWPNGARVAFWVCPNIEFYELEAPEGQGRPIWPRPYPDILNYSLRDYGNRSGVWRVMEALEKFSVRASVSLNAAMCDHMPEIVDECVRLKWEFFSHGIYNTRLIYGMNEDDIRQIIRDSTETIERRSGRPVVGWLAPALSTTETFLDLLPEFGIKYAIDVVPDDQPIPLKVRKGKLIAIPYPHRRKGLDHSWFTHQPTNRRPSVSWPDQKRIALWITVPVEIFPLKPSNAPIRPLGALPLGYPDLWNRSSRDYGLRIGLYRIMQVLDEFGIRATAAVNSEVAETHPRVVEELVKRNWEIVANGVDMGTVHYAGLDVEDERQLIIKSRDTLLAATGRRLLGWHSPGRSQSLNTLPLLAQEGFVYVTDWANDDMPYPVMTSSGGLWALPLTYELSDRQLLVQHNLTVDGYVDQVQRAFDCLDKEAKHLGSGRILSLSVTPWILGYPHRIAGFKRLLERLVQAESVWPTTGGEITAVFTAQDSKDAPG